MAYPNDPPAPPTLALKSGESINTGLVGWWPLTETDDYASGAADISGNGNAGAKQGNAQSSVSSIGYVLEQPDTSSYVTVGDVPEVKITGALTVSVWFKSYSTSPVNLVSKYDNSTNGRAYNVNLNLPQPHFVVGYGASSASVASGTTAVRGDGVWHHIVGTYDPSNSIRVYLDGVLDGENTTGVPSLINDTTFPLNIGREYNQGNAVGFLSNVRVWNTALTAQQVSDIYNTPWLGSNYEELVAGNTFFFPAHFGGRL